MFRAEQRTDGDRQRRQVRQLHALPIRQTAAATGKTDKTERNARELARKNVSVRITYNNTHGNKRNGGGILQNWHKNAGRQPVRHAHRQRRPLPAQHQGGEVYNSEGQKESAVCCNSPPRHSSYLVISPPRSHVPLSGTPIRDSHAIYRQVRGRGVVLKPG